MLLRGKSLLARLAVVSASPLARLAAANAPASSRLVRPILAQARCHDATRPSSPPPSTVLHGKDGRMLWSLAFEDDAARSPDEAAGRKSGKDEFRLDNAVSEDGRASELQKFYKGRNVLLTGATGFVGKCILEKLLRDTEVCKIFVLIRSLPGSSTQERFSTSILQSQAFERLRNIVGVNEWDAFIAARVVAVEGDTSMPKIGMCPKDYEEVSPSHVPFP